MPTRIKTTIEARTETDPALTIHEAGTAAETIFVTDAMTVTASEQVRNTTTIEGHFRL